MADDLRTRDWFSVDGNEDDEYHGSSSEDEAPRQPVKSRKRAKKQKLSSSEGEDESRVSNAVKGTTKRRKATDAVSAFAKNSSDEDSDYEEENESEDESEKAEDEEEYVEELHFPGNEKGVLKKLTSKELEDNRAKIEKSGVVYLSRIPPYMKPAKVRQVLLRFGEIGRVFLTPEDPKVYARRVRFGGNKKRNFTEGWVEFNDKRQAKLCASTMNGQIIGGRKGSYYYDDILNIKYLPKFKWHHLTEQIAYENQSRQAKLRAEISQATRVNKAFIKNVERAKMIEKIQAKRSAKAVKFDEDVKPSSRTVKEADIDMRRNFRQRDVVDDKEKDEKMQSVLKNIFA
ncbi:hypothetical protein V1512DRAFT_261054 [Lipomyces arxii]|uniref:uncharacterized protein n=1 Tax=Lipomyces arxii TaxID=56418 RepID=UPI0034CF1815